MSKKRQIVSLHDQQHRPAQSQELAVQDPIQKMAMKVSILDIEPFDKNPRKHSNEAFEEIKESIRHKGLEQPFTITRRPGAAKYMIKAGGNTRLEALHQLYEETKDDRFLKIDVIFDPYVSEANTLISHLTENDLRGNLILIDRAQGIRDTQRALEEERGMKFSVRDLEAALKEEGYTIGRTVISVLTYALDRLFPHIPKALDAGMGKAQVEKIRKFENQCRQAWKDMEINTELFSDVFSRALAKTDTDETFNFETLLNEFEEETCDATGEQLNTVRFYLEQVMRKRLAPASEQKSEEFDEEIESEHSGQSDEQPATELSSEKSQQDTGSQEELTTETSSGPFEAENNHYADEDTLPFVDDDSEEEFDEVENDRPARTVQELRETTLNTAIKLAKDAYIEDLIIPINEGYGWFLADVPQNIHFPNGFVEEDAAFKKIWRTWYTLFSLCGATSEQRKNTYKHIQQQNDLKRILTDNFDTLTDVGVYVSTAAVLNDFWEASESHVVQTAVDLIELHREIKRLAQAVNLDLWQEVCNE